MLGVAIAIAGFSMIREPTIKLQRPVEADGYTREMNEATHFIPRVRYTGRRCWELTKSDVCYIYGWLAGAGALMSALAITLYLPVWVQSLVHQYDIADYEMAEDVYLNMMAWALGFCIPLVPFLGLLADYVQPCILLPATFFIQGIIKSTFYAVVENPTKSLAKFFTFLMLLFTLLGIISVLKMYLIHVQKDVRGTMIGVLAFFAQLCVCLYIWFSNYLVDYTANYKGPIGCLAYMDFFCAIFGVIFACAGHLRFPKELKTG